MPALFYLVGMPTTVAIGTDLLEVLFSSGYGAFLYAQQARVEVIAAIIMLLGAAAGSRLGALGTRLIPAHKIRLYFACTLLATAVAVAVRQAGLHVLSIVILACLGLAILGLVLHKLADGPAEACQDHTEMM